MPRLTDATDIPDVVPALNLANIHHGYGEVSILRDFNLSMAPGQQRLLIGPSGSGKSTLINLICGFLRPDRGTIRVAGKLISEGSEATRDAVRKAHIAVVFQALRLVSAIDISANLLLAARLAGLRSSRQEALGLLTELGIADKAHARPHQLSHGEAQRAAIARALIAQPALLIADEPTSALDQTNAENVGAMLLRLAEAHGTSLLIATHDDRLRPFFPAVTELKSTVEGSAQ
ncbi:ATP-binding cassette domain-containing protein [Erythrobacter sp. QSSC1-22B]|uniref:ATP-binding cassette domain-containing protein n=1 Tax=Erythrobacter sp. QSSC1-22B TaxID=1860125 RepID=UPI001F36A806|nr:ATP-binding cassette domain-containing protein [Erythrobacter sp. QSSC1-22B]